MSGIKVVNAFSDSGDADYSNQKSRGAHRNVSYNPNAKKGKKRQPRQNDSKRGENVKTWLDTKAYCSSPFPVFKRTYRPRPITLYHTEELELIIENLGGFKPRFEKMEVEVVNADTLDTAKVEMDCGTAPDKLMALNMACKFKPGGGVKNGAHAQEEVIALRSNLMLRLAEPLYDNELQRDENILTPDIWVFKDQDKEYLLDEQQYTVNLLACAAVRKPNTTVDADGNLIYRNPIHREIMQQKINDIFQIAYVEGYETLVLGALGCGAYGNPPGEVTQIFLDCLERYRNCFKRVVFAVYSKKDDNYEWFKQCVEKPYDDRTKLLKAAQKKSK